MKLTQLRVHNYRVFKEINVSLKDFLSLVVGKNNTGKTSLLTVLNKFINCSSASFGYNDFNFEFQSKLYQAIEKDGRWETEDHKGIELYLFIQYDDNDSYANICDLMMDLDPENNIVVLKFEYILPDDQIEKLQQDWQEYWQKTVKKNKDSEPSKEICFEAFVQSRLSRYFKTQKKAVRYDVEKGDVDEEDYKILDRSVKIDKIVCFNYISARRDSDNKENDTSLSTLSGKYYERMKNDMENPVIDSFEDALSSTDASFTEIYDELFGNVIGKVKKFGGVRKNDTIIKIVSTLSQKEFLKGNTKVMYEAEKHNLPESYNGLGYMNLISMIFEIETILCDMRGDSDPGTTPADINLLFIEEPEAHTHPQMQYIFINNIKNLLFEGVNDSKDKNGIHLQTIISTHSSHIVSQSDFEDIIYFYRETPTSVISKNLEGLEIAYKNEKNNTTYKFLKQYLTLNYSEIFFANKIIMYEGDTERILLPAMMKKIDQERHNEGDVDLLSQNITLVAAGASAHLFDKFIAFLGIKTLIITDIDAVKEKIIEDKNGRFKKSECKVRTREGEYTSNAALKHFFLNGGAITKAQGLEHLYKLTSKQKIFKNENEKWVADPEGILRVAFQTEEGAYYPRSFEDAFIELNRDMLIENQDKFQGLKNKPYISKKDDYDAYDLAEKCINSKTSFAMDILINSTSDSGKGWDYTNWQIPQYIEEGLLWLRKDN